MVEHHSGGQLRDQWRVPEVLEVADGLQSGVGEMKQLTPQRNGAEHHSEERLIYDRTTQFGVEMADGVGSGVGEV